MDKIISKYDYCKGTEETESALLEELNDFDTSEFACKLKLPGLKNIINIFIEKICVKGYVQNVPRSSPGTEMATDTMRGIASIIDDCIDDDIIPAQDCYDCLFELYLAMIRVGPGTSHYEVMDKLTDIGEMNDYLKKIKGEKLKQLVTALKGHTYIPEKGISMEDYASAMSDGLPGILKDFVDDREDSEQPEIWSVMLDLFLFYLLHMKDVPVELHDTLVRCNDMIERLYDRNPYKGFPDNKIHQEHLQKISAFISSPDFKRGRQLEVTEDYVNCFCKLDNDQTVALWPDLMQFLKSLFLSKNGKDLIKIKKNFKYLFDQLDDDAMETNHKIFEVWTTNITEMLEKTDDRKGVTVVVCRMISDSEDKYKLAKGDEKYWFPLVKAMWSIPTKDMMDKVKCTMKESKFKRMWGWKENIQEAKNIIAVVEKLDLPTEGDEMDDSKCNSDCGNAIKELIKMLQIQKIEHHIMADLGRLALTFMEKKTILSNEMVENFLGEVDFKKVPEVVPELMKRFEPLIKDTDYPWLDALCASNGTDLLSLIIEAYPSADAVPDEVNKAIIRIFDFCMDDDRELINIEDGHETVWGRIIRESLIFITKHCQGGTGEVCAPVLKKLLKFRKSDEEFLRESCSNGMLIASIYCPEVCATFFEQLLDLYIEEPSSDLMEIFYRIAEKNPGPLISKMDKFIEACKKDSESIHTQISMFSILSTKLPKIFTQNLIDMLMETHYKNAEVKVQVLMVMHNVSKEKPQLIAKHVDTMMADKSTTPMEQHSLNGTIVNVAKTNEKLKDPVFKYLVDVMKKATDETQITVTIIGLKDMCAKYGPDMFASLKDYIEERKSKEHNTNISSQFTGLIDQIEGRSLQTIAQDVKETQEDVDQLDERVTGTEGAVENLATRVDEHDDSIQELAETVDTVTQRVDFAEKDIEETKIKVEEVDNKTMTNAPRWSRDLTKLMNPSDEHDWRLLAQRLGYSNDDIRAWASQHDPCMAVLSEWYATHKTREATYAVLTALQEMDRMDGAAIVENAMKASEQVMEEEDEVEYASPPPVFLSYQWGHQDEVKLIRNHLQMAGYECWMDIGQMGGGDKLFEKIDSGIRGAKVIICCVSEKYAKSPNCNREVNLSVNLGKPMIPLLMEKMSWPPVGSMGPIFSEYLFVRFFQRAGEETNDNRIWPLPKFQEMLMQLNCYGMTPEESLITEMYKNWWVPVQEEIVIDKTKKKVNQSQAKQKEEPEKENKSPDVFISYQWGKQKQIIALYKRLTSLGLSCWMDIHQMGGGDSLYEKIDSGVRGCKIVLTCVTQKYSFSANCRREVSLADALKKPMVPLLLENIDWPPSGPMSMVFTQLLYINFYHDEEVQMKWTGPKFDELMQKIGEQIPMIMSNDDNQDKKSVDNKDKAKIQENDTKKPNGSNQGNNQNVSATEKPESKLVRPVSQKGRAGAGGPQPTEKKPSPVKQDKPVVVHQTEAETTPSTTESPKEVQKKEEKAPVEKKPEENKKSSSCTLL